MFHPQANKRSDILMGFLLESGNQIGEIEAAGTTSIEHVPERGVNNLRAVTILQSVEKKKALSAQGVARFRLARGNSCRDGAQEAPDGLRARVGAQHGFPAGRQ